MKNCHSMGLSLFFAIWVPTWIACGQEPAKPSDQETPDWVSSMPVSMNGKLPTGSRHWRKGWETKHWHNCFDGRRVRAEWKAEDFFDDPDVIKLCNAIWQSDIGMVKKLIESGVDVNAVGADGMNPLYWAFHMDTDPRPFEMLLKNGANPNVVVHHEKVARLQAHFRTGGGFAVVHFVSDNEYNRQFENVFEHGGDPNLVSENFIRKFPSYRYLWPSVPDAVERVQLWIKKGAKLDKKSEDGISFVCLNCVSGEEDSLRLCHLALKGGSDYAIWYKVEETEGSVEGTWAGQFEEFKGCYFRMIHFMALNEEKVRKRPKSEQKYYQRVLGFLEQRGESLKAAHADLKRWKALIAEGKLDVIEKEHQKRIESQSEKK